MTGPLALARRALLAVDAVLAALVGVGGAASLLAAVALRGRRRQAPDPSRREMLYLGTGSLDQVTARNGVGLFLRGECSDFEGFFAHVYNVSFPAGQRKLWHLTDRHTLIDYDLPAAPLLQRAGLRLLATVAREVAFLHWATRFTRARQISMVEATNPYLQGLNAYLLGRLCGLPYGVLITRDYDFDYQILGKRAFPSVFPTRRLEKLVERWVLSRADLVRADREHYMRYGVANGARPERAHHSRVVVDEAYYPDPALRPPVREALGLGQGGLILSVGRLQPDKMPADAVRCLAHVRQQGMDATLAFAGDGELRPELARLARELGVEAHVRFLGAQPLESLPALMSAADVIIGANMGYALVEAALAGRPIVTYDYEWHWEVIHQEQTGIRVPYGDVQAMADAVVRLLRDPAYAARLGAAARAYVLEHHQRPAVMADYRRFFAVVLDAHCGRSVAKVSAT